MPSFVLDTNVVLFAVNSENCPEAYGNTPSEIMKLMLESEDNKILVDTSGDADNGSLILDEYLKNLRMEVPDGNARQLLKIIQGDMNKGRSCSKLIIWDDPIDSSEVEEFKENGFHEQDLIFLRIAPQCSTDILISCDGESIVNDEFRSDAEDNLDLDIKEPTEVPEELE